MKNNNLIFTAWEERANGASDLTVWRSKGIGEEAVKITGDYGSIVYGQDLVNINSTIFFIAEKEDGGMNLWKYDETGTSLVKEIGNVSSFVKVKDKLFFSSNSGLWTSDGTSAGTKLIKPNAEPFNSFVNFTSGNDTLFFTLGAELWQSDGTVTGTVLVKKFQNKISKHSNFIYLNDLLFFVPDNYFPQDRLKSKGLWQSDGTEAGTTAVQFPETTYLSNNSLFFFADDGVHGRELWILASSEGI
jgi:ELWxxDGT repeat protein